MENFSTLLVPQTVHDAVARLGFTTPTPIQAQAIPIALEGHDLIGCAQTGTGKTAAYCIPIFTQLLQNPDGLGLVLVPTRELARQIEDFWQELTHGSRDFACASLIGGVSMLPQKKAISRNPRMIIATPGRLIDHLQQGTIRLKNVSILVLDEADRMLDMGFEPQLAKIAKYVPPTRQTLLFSATMPPVAERVAAKFVRDPKRVSVGAVSRAAEKIEQSMVTVPMQKKNDALLDEVNRWPKDSILIFTRTKSRTDRVCKFLNAYGVEAGRLHGGRSQAQRNTAIDAFRSGDIRVMVATDIAARGIDVASVRFVINYDLPMVAEDYIHRIGRTARAGAAGEAVSLVSPEEKPLWRDILQLLKKTGSSTPSTRGTPEGERPHAPRPAHGPKPSHGGQGARQISRPAGNPSADQAPRSSDQGGGGNASTDGDDKGGPRHWSKRRSFGKRGNRHAPRTHHAR